MKNPLNAFRKTLQIPYSITAEGIWEAVLRRPSEVGDKLRTEIAQKRGSEGEAGAGKTEGKTEGNSQPPPVIAGLFLYTHTTQCPGNIHTHTHTHTEWPGKAEPTAVIAPLFLYTHKRTAVIAPLLFVVRLFSCVYV